LKIKGILGDYLKKIYPILFLLLVSVFTIPYFAKPNQSKEFQIKEITLLWSSPEYSSDPYGLNVADLYRNGSIFLAICTARIVPIEYVGKYPIAPMLQ